MITEVDPRFRRDIEKFTLKFFCEDCAHFETSRCSCSLGFDSSPHRARTIESGDTVIFCKAFELT